MGLQQITGNEIAAGSIAATDLASASITGDKLVANTVSGDAIGQNSVSANNIATNAIENYTALTNRPLSNRNIIINGAMQIAQRNANTTAITTDGYYSPDRWNINISSSGTWTMNVDSAGVNRVGPDEFSNSCNLICTTADSSLSAGDFLVFQQRFEGLNVQQIEKGTPAAESVTVSWYAKSSNTGTYICELFDNDNTRQCSKSWTINAANTWEKKSVTFPADATGRLDNDNLLSFILNFWLAAGTTWTSGTLNTTWASTTSANRAVGQFNLAGNINNYMAITGVQMELGSVATPFERRPYGTELALCQRYYEKSYNVDVVPATNTGAGRVFVTALYQSAGLLDYGGSVPFRVSKRANPTISYWREDGTSGSWDWATAAGSGNLTAILTNRVGTTAFSTYATGSGFTNTPFVISGHWVASIEL